MITKEQFLAQWGKANLAELRKACLDHGHKLVAERKSDAVEEAWEVVDAMQNGRPLPSKEPAPAAELVSVSSQATPPVAGTKELLGDRPLAYMARFSGKDPNLGKVRRRAGYVLTRQWQKLEPSPSAEQLARLRADKVIELRIA